MRTGSVLLAATLLTQLKWFPDYESFAHNKRKENYKKEKNCGGG